MEKVQLMDKYPVRSKTFPKQSFRFASMDEAIAYLKQKVDEHDVGRNIAVFDHFSHTGSQEEGYIDPSIVDAKVVIFCFGRRIDNYMQPAVRPRTIALVETSEDFTVSFMEPPNDNALETMIQWVEEMST